MENVNLRNNHSIVFAFDHPFENAEAFADSIMTATLPADSVPDTITVTVGDSVYFMGFLPLYADKIYRFEWIFGDSVITSQNTAPQSWAYDSAGIYFPIFRAVDGNNAIDTAGIHRRPLYIRVINTPPDLYVPRDTVKARHKKSATFNIWAADSFGTVVDVKVDIDGPGKDSAKVWETKKVKGSDSLTLTVPYKKDNVDSLGNQTIYVIAVDDDGNETLDTVYIHFNQLPTIELLQPLDGGRFSNKERFAFYYRAEDKDNPGSLRYYIRVAKSPDGRNPPIFTDPEENLVARNIAEKSFEIIDTTGKNLINLSGILYWDVWVTDGYDTVIAKHIDDGGKSRPWKFFLGNLDNTNGNFKGYAKYQSWHHHSGIRIAMEDTLGNFFYGATKESGYYSMNVPPGSYNVYAVDTTNYRFDRAVLKDRIVVADDTTELPSMTLKDTANPVIVFNDKIDTIRQRDYQFAFKLYDFGSQVDSAMAWLDGEAVEASYFTANSWTKNVEGLSDGEHSFALVVRDSAGLLSDTTKLNFAVRASLITLTVNDKGAASVNKMLTLNFKAKVENAIPMPDSVTWETNIEGAATFRTAVEDSVATLGLDLSQLPAGIKLGTLYEMVAKTATGVVTNKVRFGFYDEGPVVYFESPAKDTMISVNDTIAYKVFAFHNNSTPGDEYFVLDWTCQPANPCPADMDTVGELFWSEPGIKKVIVGIKNTAKETAVDTLVVNVEADPPTVHVVSESVDNRHKINSSVELRVSASDRFGTITKIEWGCTNGSMFTFDDDTTFANPQKSVTNVPISVLMPGTASENYKCIVKVTDDDGESANDTAYFRVLQDLPYISLNITNQTLTIKDQVQLGFVAIDTLGEIVGYELACDSVRANLKNNWTAFAKNTTPTVTMPPEACKWYCAIRVTDDDNNKASDTATFTVLLDPPTVRVLGNYTVTIKDTLGLDAMASDLYGRIALYEWGCGSADAQNIGFTYSSTTSPQYSAIMPATAQSGYKCIIRVTDDDGNTARDTALIDIILAPPTVVVTNKTAIVREGYNIVLGANAYDYPDYPGFIEKREWSCGTPSEIAANWKTVSDYDTVWKAPAATATFYCIARATDNDGNTAMDTMTIQYSTELPVISVKDEEIYVTAGDLFELNASVNNVWQGISWFTWECFDQKKDTSLEANVTRYDYYKNGSSFYDYRPADFTMDGRDMYCVVSAEESSTKAVFRDTTFIRIIKQSPVGVITAADTVWMWSGDESFDNGEAYYFYDTAWGGKNSTLGTIGDRNMQDFWWNFSNVDGNYYQGNRDGSLDTSVAEFNSAFIRSSRENSVTICLDYRDSSTTHLTPAFYSRHRAEEVCRKVYFRKAWRNLAADTVLETSKMTTPPVLATVSDKPVVAYLSGPKAVVTKYLDGNTWKSVSTASIAAADSIVSLKLKVGGSNLYLAVLTSAGSLSVYKSANGTSTWASVGDAIEGASVIALDCHPTSGNPLVSFIDATTKTPKYSRWSGSAWVTDDVAGPAYRTFTTTNCHRVNHKDVCDTTYTDHPVKVRELQPAYLQNGSLAFVMVDTTSAYQSYYTLYGSDYSVKKSAEMLQKNVNGITLAADGSTLYFGFLNRDTEKYGPYVYKGSVDASSIAWTKTGVFGQSIHEGILAYHISLAAFDGKLYAIVDDKGKPSLAQSHVFYLDGSTWKLMGENELPYFKTVFYNNKHYYLRGSVPNIAVASNGKVFISMLAWENAGGRGVNFGPIVMKYVADTWTVH